jgi:hypothetical protein
MNNIEPTETEQAMRDSIPMIDATYSPTAKAWMERKHVELYEAFAPLMQEIESRPGMSAKQVKQSDAYQKARQFYSAFKHWVVTEAAEFDYGYGGKPRQKEAQQVEQKEAQKEEQKVQP